MTSKNKLVPIEPTQKMIEEGLIARTHPRERYKAMLAAAPTVAQAPEVAVLVEALEGFLAIVSESSGVAGYHLNGEIAHWREFEEVVMAEEALELYRQQGGGQCS